MDFLFIRILKNVKLGGIMKGKAVVVLFFLCVCLVSNAISTKEISLEKLKNLADRNADELWGKCYRAEPIPYYGPDDEIIAYHFNYSLDGDFPDKNELIESCDKAFTEGSRKSGWGDDHFANMVIGAKPYMPVFIEYGKCLSPQFALGKQIERAAEREMGTGFEVDKIYYLGLVEVWYCIKKNSEKIYINIDPIFKKKTENEFREFISQKDYFWQRDIFDDDWQKFYTDKETMSRSNVWIPGKEYMPFLEWHYGCTPTSAAMLLAWYDNYHGFGNLIDYHYSSTDYIQDPPNHIDPHVPRTQYDLKEAMDTDGEGSTSRGDICPGYIEVVEDRGYDCSSDGHWAFWWTVGSLFDDVKESINANKPCHISIEEHSIIGVGYCSSPAKVHTHDPNRSSIRTITRSMLEGQYWVNITNNYGSKIQISSPNGNLGWKDNSPEEQLFSNDMWEITWNGNYEPDTYCKIYYHINGGSTLDEWTLITANTSNDGSYDWLVPVINDPYYGDHSDACRVKIELYNSSNEIIAMDGSYGNFAINAGGELTEIETMINENIQSTPDYFFFNHDQQTWGVVGATHSDPTEFWYAKLYDTTDFNDNVIEEARLWDQVNYIVIDGYNAPEEVFGLKLESNTTNTSGSVQFDGTKESLTTNTTHHLNFTSADIVGMWDVYLTPGDYYFELDIPDGNNADYDFSLFKWGDDSYFDKQNSVAFSRNVGYGVDESFHYSPLQAGNYGLCVVSNNIYSGNFDITIESSGVWDGDVSTSWFDPDNWSGYIVPDCDTDITIPAGCPHYPALQGNHAAVHNLTVDSGASLTVHDVNLGVYGDLNVLGELRLTGSSSVVECQGNITWHDGSTATVNMLTASFVCYRSWRVESGADVSMNKGKVHFVSDNQGFIINDDPNTTFYNVRIDKPVENFEYHIQSDEDWVILGDLTIESGTMLHSSSFQTIEVGDLFTNHGNFQLDAGTFKLSGTNAYPSCNTGDYFYNLEINTSSVVALLSDLHVKGDLTINSGGLMASSHNIYIGGSWRNNMGSGGFNEGTGTVYFNGNGQSDCYGEEFNNLVLDNSNCELHFDSGTSSCDSWDWVAGTLYIDGGTFTANDIVANGIEGKIYIYSGELNFHQGVSSYLDLRGELHMHGGTFNLYGGTDDSYWPYGHHAWIEMTDGVIDFKTCGIKIYNTPTYLLTADLTGGVIKTIGDVTCDRIDFEPEDGTFELYGSSNANLTCNYSSNFGNIIVNKSSSKGEQLNYKKIRDTGKTEKRSRGDIVYANSGLNLTGDLIVQQGNFICSEETINVGNDVEIHDTFTMTNPTDLLTVGSDFYWESNSTANVTNGEMQINGWLFVKSSSTVQYGTNNITKFIGSKQSGLNFNNSNAYINDLIIDKTSNETITYNGSGIITINGNCTLSSGNELNIDEAYILVNGNFDAETSSSLTIENDGLLEVDSDFSSDGTNTINTGELNCHNHFLLDDNGELTINGGDCILDRVYTGNFMNFSGTLNLLSGNLEITNEGIQFGTGATPNMTNGTIRVGWCFKAIQSNAFHPTGGTIEMFNTGSPDIECTNGNFFHNLIINKELYSGNAYLADNIIVKNDLTILDGTLHSLGHQITVYNDIVIESEGKLDPDEGLVLVAGNWTNNRGDTGFVEDNSTVRFFYNEGSSITTDETFYNLNVIQDTGNYLYFEVEDDVTINVLHNMNIQDGTVMLNNNSTLDIDNDLTISDGAGLLCYVVDNNQQINIGGDFTDNNTSADWYYGFTPNNSTVIFDGSSNQLLQTNYSTFVFNNLSINQTGTYFYPYTNVLVQGDFSLTDGCWNNPSIGMTHTFEGDVSISENGWNSNMSTIVFSGSNEATYQKGSGVVHHNITIDKTDSKESDRSAETLTLLSDIYLNWEGDLMINSGSLNSNGNTISCSGNVIINGGSLYLDDNSTLRVGNDKSLSVNSGGVLETIGSSGNEVNITCYNVDNYHNVEINSNGTIRAEYTIFQYTSSNGVYAKTGSYVDPSYAFNYCTFQHGEPEGRSNSYLLQFRNEQNITVSNPIFPANTWNSTYNICKVNDAGMIYVADATGDFAGESYDLDPYDRINWTSGPGISVSPSSQDFGDVIVGQSGRSGFFIENTGGSLLTGTITTPAGFTVLPDYKGDSDRNTINYSVDPGDTDTILLDFEPTEIQTYSGDVIITHNAIGANETVFLTGNGIAVPPPEIEVSPDTLYFGDVLPGEKDTLSFSIYNAGQSNLIGTITTPVGYTVSVWEWKNASGESKSVKPSTPNRNSLDFDIGPTYSFDYNVVFEPLAMQDYTNNITITHNAEGGTDNILCIGRGAEAVLGINPNTFSQVLSPNTSDSQTLALSNDGNLDLEYYAYVEYDGEASNMISESFEGSFPPTGWSLQDIDGYGNWSLCDYYAYAGYQSAQASSMESNNARLISPYFTASSDCIMKFWLSAGTGAMMPGGNIAELFVEASTDGINWTILKSYDQEDISDNFKLEYVTLGQYSGQNIKIAFRVDENYTGSGVNIDEIIIRGDVSPIYSWLTLDSGANISGEIAVGDPTENIQVGFNSNGLTDGSYFASIRTISNDSTDPEYDIQVNLNVGTYGMTISPTSLAFGGVNVGEQNTLQFTIENTGTLTLDGTIVTPFGYSVDEQFVKTDKNSLSYHLFPNDSMEYDVTFEPSYHGDYNGSITITHNMGGNDEYISVTGVGKAAEISVTPDFFTQEQMPDVTNTQTMTIDNTGNIDLTYSASISYQEEVKSTLISSGFEDIDFPPAGWNTEILSDGGDWFQTDIDPYDGTYCAFADGFMIVDARLVTPSFTAQSDTQLSYYIRTDEYAMYGGSFGVEVSTDGLNWNFIDQIDVSTLSGIYEEKILPLNSYEGLTIQIAFRFYDNPYYSADAVYLDNVVIGSGPTPTDQWLSLNGENSFSGTVEPGRIADIIDVGFDSAGLTEGIYTADIVIDSNDPMNPQYLVIAELIVGYPQISVTPDSIGFGPILVGEEFSNYFSIENTGSISLTGTITTPEGYTVTNSFVKTGEQRNIRNTINYEILPYDMQNFELIFSPQASIDYNGNMVITHNSIGNNEFVIVTGSGYSLSLDVPENVIIEIIGSDIQLSWNEVSAATSYSIYSSTDPFMPKENWNFKDSTTQTTWSEPIPITNCYYYIKAVSGAKKK